jgi:hypothetical protein
LIFQPRFRLLVLRVWKMKIASENCIIWMKYFETLKWNLKFKSGVYFLDMYLSFKFRWGIRERSNPLNFTKMLQSAHHKNEFSTVIFIQVGKCNLSVLSLHTATLCRYHLLQFDCCCQINDIMKNSVFHQKPWICNSMSNLVYKMYQMSNFVPLPINCISNK